MKANLLAVAALVIGALAAASCADERVIPAPAPGPMPAPRPAPPAPAPSVAWADRPATPGDWRWSKEGEQSIARFAGGRLTLRCVPGTREIHLERSETGNAPASTNSITVRTQTMTRAIPARAQGGVLTTNLGTRDPLLDAMAFTRGRFAVEAAGYAPLYVPSWTEVSRVIEDCR